MIDTVSRWAGRVVIGVFGGAFVLAVVMIGVQVVSKVGGWIYGGRSRG